MNIIILVIALVNPCYLVSLDRPEPVMAVQQ
jgi:hypothetical protein